MVVSGWWRDEALRDDAWGCSIGAGMTIVEEIPRLAALARNDKVAMFRMIVEVLAWGTVVAAGGFVVAAADGFVEWVAVGINVEGEAALTATGRAGVAAAWIGVFLKGVVV